MSETTMKVVQRHPYHLVDPSPWPLFASTGALSMTFGGVMWFHSYTGGGFFTITGMLFVFFCMFTWWRDIVREATFEGQHTEMVQLGMRQGMILFIASEVMFFFAFFWAFFHAAASPVLELGYMWPPQGIECFSAWEIPLLNTVILLTSGATCTWAHHAIVAGDRRSSILGLVFTLALAVLFTAFQVYEYKHASFTMSDGIYGSTFYMATGFHGFHVQIGTIFLAVCLVRLYHHHFTREAHFGFEAAAWYWHFVDVVWLFLFVAVYWWGGI